MEKKYRHDRLCDYCQSQGNGPSHKDGGCSHYRGGKTARKKGR